MSKPGVTRRVVVALLRDQGPLTAAEIQEQTGLTRPQVKGVIAQARRTHGTEIFRIHRYQLRECGSGREAIVWGLGPGRDAVRPVIDTKARKLIYQRRHRQKMRALVLRREAIRRGTEINIFSDLLRR